MKAVNIIWDADNEEDITLLPTEIKIPKGMTDEDDISDYLSHMTGFCHKGYALERELDDIIFCSINLFVSEDELQALKLNREDDDLLDDDELHKICDSVEMFDNDKTLVVCICGDAMYEIATTHNRHNLYLFESKAISDEEYETVNVTNVSSDFDDIKTYSDLIGYILPQNTKRDSFDGPWEKVRKREGKNNE